MSELALTGLDGGNPLGFLAALGTLRALTSAWPDRTVRMSWTVSVGWKPVLHGCDEIAQSTVATLYQQMQETKEHPTLNLADSLTVSGDIYREHLLALLARADSHETLSYAAAFGSDLVRDDKGNIADTALRTMSGAGHQHFLKTMRDVLNATTEEHLRKALFEPWKYDDPLKGLSLRFDPLDDKRRALRWREPSGDPTRNSSGNVLGANALAVLGIPLLVTLPVGAQLETTSFRGHRSNDCFWTWPIWSPPLTLSTVVSLLALQELQTDEVPRDHVAARGVVEVFRSQRITEGKFRNFTPARPV